MSDRQSRYEAFLDSVTKKQDAVIVRDLPKCLGQLVGFIKEAGEILKTHPNWDGKTVPRLRELYRTAMTALRSEPSKALTALQDSIFILNGWQRRLSWRVVIKTTHTNDSRTGADPHAVRIDSVTLVKEPCVIVVGPKSSVPT